MKRTLSGLYRAVARVWGRNCVPNYFSLERDKIKGGTKKKKEKSNLGMKEEDKAKVKRMCCKIRELRAQEIE